MQKQSKSFPQVTQNIKMREIVIISLKILVPLAGLEPARMLLRRIFKAYASKIDLN